MNATHSDVSNAVETEIKLFMTQQLHRKGFLTAEMCASATEIILREAKKEISKNPDKKAIAALQ
ncbi:MAG: hypothetical protein FWG87_00265 [Defluviitaleaceae bacterium]|nr:hypothetical protein [Defluviitaleaceae bacterium]